MNAHAHAAAQDLDPPMGWALRSVRRYWLIVALCVVVAAGAAGAYSSTRDSVYRADLSLVVGQDGGLLQPGALSQSPEPFTQTISSLLTSDVVALTVIRELKLDFTPNQLIDGLDVTSRPESTVLEVGYESTDRQRALDVLTSIATRFPKILADRFPASQAPSGAGSVTVSIFDTPRLRAEAVSPRPAQTIVIAGLLGLAIGIALALARASLDRDRPPRRAT